MKRLFRTVACSVAMVLVTSACEFSVYSVPLPGGADVGDDSYAVTVQFRDVLDLVPQSAVKVDEVTVGKVEEISLDGYTAVVEVRLNGDVELPQNALAMLRQTSLLGEKFVELAPPSNEAPTGRLSEGDVIPLSRSGRNPEVEEVLAALSLLLNGGGVAQLKTISSELNKALSGNEAEIKDVLGQLDDFMGQLDTHKGEIVQAIRSINKLTISVKQQETSIVNALEELPGALKVLNQQRRGLVKMLKGLKKLSPVAVRVIRASKQTTLANLKALDPILTQLANAGDALPKSLQAFLTYPFVDAVVGTSPTEARNFHMGDYTNLSVQLDLDLNNLPPLPGDLCDLDPNLPICDEDGDTNPCQLTPDLPICNDDGEVDLCELPDVPATDCEGVTDCVTNPDLRKCTRVVEEVCEGANVPELCKNLVDAVCDAGGVLELCPDDGGDGGTGGGGGDDGGGGGDGGVIPDPCEITGLCRPGPDYGDKSDQEQTVDGDLALLLMQGVSR